MPEALDARAVRRWVRVALDALAAAREEIDALNVYPVADGDTGTNMFLTVEAATEAVETLPDDADLARTVGAMAEGALLGARGSSGVILSQLIRGIASTLAVPVSAPSPLGSAAGSVVVAAALRRAADMGYAAVARPVEGTMLSVARAAADAAASASGSLGAVTRAAADGARAALARTPDQLDVLRHAGVVDAGGRGLTVVLDALAAVVTGVGALPPARPQPRPCASLPDRTGQGGDPAFEVMYLLDADDDDVPALRDRLDVLGDAVVVVGGDRLWNVHAHVDDAGAAIEAGLDLGRPRRIRVSRLGGGPTPQPGADLLSRAVVAVAAGDGIAEVFAAAGATVVRGAPGRRASTRDLLAAIRAAGTREVIVLPNDPSSLAVAEAASGQVRAEGIRIAVVPTAATVQGLAALAAHEPGRRFEDDVVHMTAAASHARHGGVTVATKDAVTAAGRCRPGDVLGIIGRDFVEIGDDPSVVACRVVDRMLVAGGELVTLVTGAPADESLAATVVDHLERTRPDLDTLVYAGGQVGYPLLVCVE